MKQLVEERKFVDLDVDLAKHYLNFNDYPAQRETRVGHINDLSEKMIDGRFRFGEIAFAVSKNGEEREVMMNGQHVCHAVIESGVTVPCVIERFLVGNALESSTLFKQFENFSRTQSDFNNAESIGLDLDWPKYIVNVVISAAVIDSKNKEGRAITDGGNTGIRVPNWLTREKKSLLIRKYLKEGEFIKSILGGLSRKETQHICRSAIVFVMMNTWRVNDMYADIFWTRVRDGEGLRKKDPEKKLREFLLRVNMRYTQYSHRRATNHEFICKASLAWNAARRGTTTNLAYSPMKKIPALIY